MNIKNHRAWSGTGSLNENASFAKEKRLFDVPAGSTACLVPFQMDISLLFRPAKLNAWD